MYNSRIGLNQRSGKQHQLLCDADYFSEMICKPVNMFTALGSVPESSLVLKLFPSSVQSFHTEMHESPDGDQSVIDLEVSQSKELRERSGVHQKFASVSSYADISLSDSMGMSSPVTELFCEPTAKSLYHTLGELHNLGKPLNP